MWCASLPYPGSSPLTRGKRPHVAWLVGEERLIPAHAGKTKRLDHCLSYFSTHPRSRGENANVGFTAATRAGSSPLTRGKRRYQAGTTAHPRSRGENPSLTPRASASAGSSPLTRGKHSDETLSFHPARLIPAHAGKTVSRTSTVKRVRAHPRSRGENSALAISPGTNVGSSPLTRGKRDPPADRTNRRGLIPAHAGKTDLRPSRSAPWAAHPRSRGENHSAIRRAESWSGSSPLTRGKPAVAPRPRRDYWLIPAHAGKTDAALPRPLRKRGSSPLTRGKLGPEVAEGRRGGLIPAHAGKTPRRGRPRAGIWAHPRSRGENSVPAGPSHSVSGSSPLTRGKRRVGRHEPRRTRLIPAHAGKTHGGL